jgi:predicted Zn-dependent protease
MTGGRFFENNPYPNLPELIDAIQNRSFEPHPRLNDYRFYVITHETGHALGLDHPKKKQGILPGTLGSVMM